MEKTKIAEESELDQVWFELEKKMKKNVPEKLYHYTGSSSAISNMLTEKCLWLSPYDDMNDPSEIRHGLEIAINHISESKFEPRLENALLEEITKIFTGIKDRVTFYFACFSNAGDTDISQWREYGNKGLGYCIEFDSKNAFIKEESGQNIVNPRSHLLEVIPVKYNDWEKKDLMKDFFDLCSPFFKNYSIEKMEVIMAFLKQLCACFKHKAYESEQEWRHIQLCYDGNFIHKSSSIKSFSYGDHFREKTVTPLPAQCEWLDCISKITCGPKQNHARYKATKMAVQEIQKKIGTSHSITVEHSTVPMI